MNPATAVTAIQGVSGLLKATGATNNGATVGAPQTSASPYNSSGSTYNITSGGANEPLIGGGILSLSSTKLLIIGGLAIVGLLLYKR